MSRKDTTAWPQAAAGELLVSGLYVNQLNDQVYELLKAEIMKGNLTPGQRLNPGLLASRLGVSATPVRDALQRLSADGLVEVSPRRGTAVSVFTRESVRETFRTRRIIESAAAEEVGSISDEALAELQAIVERFAAMRQGDTFIDHAAHMALDTQFHRHIVDLLRSRQLSEFYDKLRWPEQVVRGLSRSNYQRAEMTVAEHVAILQALRARDAGQTRARILRHLSNAEADLLRRMPPDGAS